MRKFRKQRSARKTKMVFVGIISFLFIAFITTAAIAYHEEVFDFTFIERETSAAETDTVTVQPDETDEIQPETDTQSDLEETTAAPDTETAPSEETSAPEETQPSETEAVTEPAKPDADHGERQLKAYISSLDKASELSADGYKVTSDSFTSDFIFAVVETDAQIGSEYSLGSRTVFTHERVLNDAKDISKGFIIAHNAAGEEERPVVDVYMDYIIVHHGEKCTLLKSDGTVLIEDFDVEYYVPAYTRDKSGNALFKAEEQSRYNPKNTVTRYYYVAKNGTLQVSNYNDATDNRGIYVNYPADFGVSDSGLNVYHNTEKGLFGYGASSDAVEEEDYRYIAAYGHSSGLAVAVETDGLLYILAGQYDEETGIMKTYISAAYEYYQQEPFRRFLRHLLLQKTFGEESLGYLYFDHGLIRVRAQIIDAWHWETYGNRKISTDSDILLRLDGSEFSLPPDYDLVAYSDGILLLEKNGYYGYMDYTGKWILDPIYTYAEPFYEGLAAVGTDGAVGLIDVGGNFVISPLFDYVSSVSGGAFAAYDGDYGWVIFNKMAK